jgi:hypothetical protein
VLQLLTVSPGGDVRPDLRPDLIEGLREFLRYGKILARGDPDRYGVSRNRATVGDRRLTYLDVFVGELSEGDDPLDWGGDVNGNLPKVRGPYFPPQGSGAPFSRLRRKIASGEFPGKQVDWGAWAAKVSKEQILDFIDEVYRGDNWYVDPTIMAHLFTKMEELMAYVRSLPDGRSYALVACEL